MPSTAPRLPLDLGHSVHRRSDPTNTVGTIVGLLFRPSDQALVRWPNGGLTLEVLADLIDEARTAADERASIAEKIRRRLDIGTLLKAAPAKTYTRYGQRQPCDACDQPITPAQAEYDLEYRNVQHVFRLHHGCYGLWEAECRRRGYRAAHRAGAADGKNRGLCK
jgi:hypothetical protein